MAGFVQSRNEIRSDSSSSFFIESEITGYVDTRMNYRLSLGKTGADFLKSMKRDSRSIIVNN